MTTTYVRQHLKHARPPQLIDAATPSFPWSEARRIKRVQRDLMVRLRAMPVPDDSAARKPPTPAIPRHMRPKCLEDLLHPQAGRRGSKYFHVYRKGYRWRSNGKPAIYYAVTPRIGKEPSRRLGDFASEDEAGWAVVRAMGGE